MAENTLAAGMAALAVGSEEDFGSTPGKSPGPATNAAETLRDVTNSTSGSSQRPSPTKPTVEVRSAKAAPSISAETKARFNRYVKRARLKEQDCLYQEAIALYRKALDIHESQKVLEKVASVQALRDDRVDLGNGFLRDDNAECCVLDDRFFLPTETYDSLYPHQREGVRWLYSLYADESGGILGDDMVCASQRPPGQWPEKLAAAP